LTVAPPCVAGAARKAITACCEVSAGFIASSG
jgi:hypothetical protein